MGLLGGLEDDVDEGGDVGHIEDAIAVEVVGQELGEMCAGSDVSPKVNAPQACAVETVTIDEYGRREARL